MSTTFLQTSLFGDEYMPTIAPTDEQLEEAMAPKQTLERAIELTKQAMFAKAYHFPHWVIAYSGGKDSSFLVAVIIHLIVTGQIPAPESLTVMYSDTRREITPLHAAAMEMLNIVESMGFKTKVVVSELDRRYWVYRLGYGIPAAKAHLRWCTEHMKIAPMNRAMQQMGVNLGYGKWEKDKRGHEKYVPYGKWLEQWDDEKQKLVKVFKPDNKILLLTGMRIGESALRDQKILKGMFPDSTDGNTLYAAQTDLPVVACSVDGGECGQGFFQKKPPTSVVDAYAPIVHARVCNVWDALTFHAPGWGFPTQMIAQVYGGDDKEELNARTGCMGCDLIEEDRMFGAVLRIPEWKYLAPLTRIKPLIEESRDFKYRLRKDGTQRLKDGGFPKNPYRVGPLTLDARRHFLAELLGIQGEVNEAADRLGRPRVDLLNEEEHARILELIESGAMPQGWDGDEMLATEVYSEDMITINRKTAQFTLFYQPRKKNA